jgi:hypothetical protein
LARRTAAEIARSEAGLDDFAGLSSAQRVIEEANAEIREFC